MTRGLRRSLTALGAGIALFGAVRATQGARPAIVASPALRPLRASLAQQHKATTKLEAALKQVQGQDAKARAQVVALHHSVTRERHHLAAARAAAARAAAAAAASARAPRVHTRTGASGGHHDDGGGGDG